MDGEVIIGVKLDKSGLSSSLSKLEGDLGKSVSRMEKNIGKMFSFIKGSVITAGIALAFKAISGSIDDAISRLDTMNNYTNVMSNLGVSAEDAQKSIDYMSDKLQGLPTTLNDAVSSVQRFTAANGNVLASTEIFLSLNNAILAGGAPMEQQRSALEQLSQAYAKGKPDMMEWRTAMSAMPAQLKQVGMAMGYASADELGQALRSGKVSMNEFMTTITKLNKEGVAGFSSFEEQARNSTGGVATSITNLRTAITRGLADIMNAIGQSNIAGFFQGIARAINKVFAYIVAFIKVLGTAINFIRGLFGKKSISGASTMQKSISGASSSMNNLSDGASKTNKGLGNATKSAKKLKKELQTMPFDEMNVLQENTSSSGGSGGGSGPGGAGDMSAGLGDIDLSGLNGDLTTTNSLADEIYEKMSKWFAWFTEDMNFQPLVDSFKNLGEAISYLVDGVGVLWGSFVENYIKPIATWTINEALPHFFNSTANAIKGIDFTKINEALKGLWNALVPFTKNVGSGLLWFYDNVLIPLGTWVMNEVVPAFLKILSGAINVVNTAIETARPFFLWLWNSFLQPIASWTGGVIVDVLNAIGSALEWIASHEAVVAFIEGVAIAIGLIVGAITLYNAVMAVAAAVTGVFSAAIAILTSPITLVVAAIGAVIAIIILLIKHWDEVKEVASNVWNKIKEIWGAVSSWFNDNIIQPIKTLVQKHVEWFNAIITALKNLFVNMWNGIKSAASTAWNGIKAVWGVVKAWFNDKIVTPIKTVFGTLWTGLKTGASKAWAGIRGAFKGVASFFGGLWNKIKSKFTSIGTKIGQAVGGAFKKAVNSVFRTLEKIVNTPINAINGLIGIINKVPRNKPWQIKYI